MTIMSVSASRHVSGFTIQSILGDTNKEGTERSKKINKDVIEKDKCTTCSLNQKDDQAIEYDHRLKLGGYGLCSNDELLNKLHYAHYGQFMSQEYFSRVHDDFRKFWNSNSYERSNAFYSPFRINDSLSSRVSATHVSGNSQYLLSHLRKPKRVRTAFSPSQLLRLEHAFEKNHYVVGQERKELAALLGLTETQVKVWFQNRRTKHKRIRAEDEMTKSLARTLEKRETQTSPQYEAESEDDMQGTGQFNESDDEGDIEV